MKPVRCRPATQNDIHAIVALERSHRPHLDVTEFVAKLVRHQELNMALALRGHDVVGWCGYLLFPDAVTVQRLCVHSHERRTGVGRHCLQELWQMAEHLAQIKQQPCKLICLPRESDTRAHLFLRACGLRCIGILPAKDSLYPDEAAYHFERETAQTGLQAEISEHSEQVMGKSQARVAD